MKIATILFTYNRSIHTQKALKALRDNTILPDKLFVFQDGLKCEDHRQEWENVKRVIYKVSWCDIEIVESEKNKGLADSVVDGVNRVLAEYDAAVILEDDCIAHPLFMEYVTECLTRYRDNKEVFSINGYSWNVNISGNGSDVYFTGRAGSWGWATWKDRWSLYKQNYKTLQEIKSNPESKKQIDIWGQDLEAMLLHNVDGRSNSWAVFWALQCIKQGGFCPTPYYSLIDNIGFDGTGVHCGKANINTRVREWMDLKHITFPEKVEFPIDYEEAYANWFKWTNPEIKFKCYNEILLQWNHLLQRGISIAEYFRKYSINRIAVWGKGNLCKSLLYELKDQVEVTAIVESNPRCELYESLPVIRPEGITDEIRMIVVIPVYDMESIRKRVKKQNIKILKGLDEILSCLSAGN